MRFQRNNQAWGAFLKKLLSATLIYLTVWLTSAVCNELHAFSDVRSPSFSRDMDPARETTSRPLTITIVASELHEKYRIAAQMALDRFNLTGQQVQVAIVDSHCDYRKALTQLINQRDHIDVLVLEPRCREVACRVTDFASEWEVPVVSPIPLQRTDRKETLIQLSVEYRMYGLVLQELFDHFKWNRAAFLTSTVDAECPAVVTEVYNLLMKSNSSVAHDIYEEKLKPPDYREVLLKTAQYAKIVVTCLTEQGLRSLLKASEDLGYTETGRMFFVNIQLPSKHFPETVPYSQNLLNIRAKPMLQGKLIRDQIKQRVEFLSEANYTKLIQVYDAVFLYASVVQESYSLVAVHPGRFPHRHDPPKVMLERLLNKSSFNSGSTEELHLSQGRPQIELQVVSYDAGRAKVVFILSEKEDSNGHEVPAQHGAYGNSHLAHPMHTVAGIPHVAVMHEPTKDNGVQLLKVGQIHWIGGHAPNDQPWGDPDLPQMAVVFAALGAFIFVLIVAFLLIHRWIKANTIISPPDEETMDDTPKDPSPNENFTHTYRSTSPSHVRYTLLSPNDIAHQSRAC